MPFKNKEDRAKWLEKNKNLSKEYSARYLSKNPWQKVLAGIRARCTYKESFYYKRGIKNFLNNAQIKMLWLRDEASKLIKPSIDRINPDGHYCVDNCRFIELTDNLRNVRRSNGWKPT